MSDIFREVDEALQREKAAKFWKEYGPTLIMAAVLLVVSTAATTGYRTWDSHRNKQETAELITAAESRDMAAAMEEAAKDTRGGHKAIALLNAAAKVAEGKDFAKAASLYQSLSDDQSAPDDLRDLATVLGVRAAMLTQTDGTVDAKAQVEKLLPVAKNKKSAFQLQAKLDAALLYGDALKDYTAALDLLNGFDADTVPDSIKEKADALKHVYEYENANAAAKTSAHQQHP